MLHGSRRRLQAVIRLCKEMKMLYTREEAMGVDQRLVSGFQPNVRLLRKGFILVVGWLNGGVVVVVAVLNGRWCCLRKKEVVVGGEELRLLLL